MVGGRVEREVEIDRPNWDLLACKRWKGVAPKVGEILGLKIRGPKLGLDCGLALKVSALEAWEVLGSSIHISETVAATARKFLR